MLTPLAVALALAATGAWAKAPANATGECKDGSYTTSASKEGACSSHGGVKTWLAKASADTTGKKAAAEPTGNKAAADKPADATGQCKDGSYTTAGSKSGACSGHKGVKSWYGASKDQGSTKKESPAMDASPGKAAGKTSSSAMERPSSTASSGRTSASTAAAGGGAGKVWVNTDSKVYHCEKDAMYGKTKQGEYMSEAQAKAAGARASRGKECS